MPIANIVSANEEEDRVAPAVGDAVAADNDGIALGEVQVGDAAQAQADSAVHAGAGVLLEVLPELGLFLPGLGTAIQQQEDVADGHHDGEVVEHVGPQTLLVFQGVQVLAVDHVLGDPQLLI